MLSVSPELLGVPVLPVGSARWSLLHGLVSSLVHASGLLAGGGETAELSMVVLGGDDPVDTWVASDGLVGWVHEDDLKELEAGILTNPVGVEDAHVAAFTGDALFSDRLVSALGLDLLYATGVSGLTEDLTLGDVSLAATSADADTVDDVALLGLVTYLSSLISAGRSGALVDDGKLTELPGADSHDESADIALLLSPKLFEVFVCSHLLFNNVNHY